MKKTKNAVLAACVSLVSLCLFSLPAVAQETLPPDLGTRPQGTDWPIFLGPSHDSKSTETGLTTPWPEAGPRVVWQRPLGTSYGIGSVSRGRFFQFDRYDDVERLSVLNAETGEQLWKFEYPTSYEDSLGYNNGPRTSPIIDGDRVYIYGAEGKLHCLQISTQKLIWKVDLSERFGVVQNFFGVGSSPVIDGDLILVMVGGSPPESHQFGRFDLDRVIGKDSGVVALNKRTGEVVYHISDELASYASMTYAEINGRPFAFAFARGGLLAFHPETGVIDFHFPWRAKLRDSVNASTPVIVGDEVFISETYGPGSALLKVKTGGYDVVWEDDPKKRDKAMQTHWNTAVYHDGYLYGSSGRHSNNAELRCIEWKTGKVKWSVPGLARSSLLYVDGHFVCLSEDGVLRLIKANPEKYDLVSETDLRQAPEPGARVRPLLTYPAWAAPILSHGLLYVRGDNRLVCLEVIPKK
ncbi:PQQ-binding-like beta-propeller repeat protein [Blastopirellula retiformator]|uniref:Outer membrane biogenesis protein BamB n=1 Tax=Blastopirellula retiformator TaxID=2527970 RepID=A0A5C5V168_9BACT|nr:PQQ-binding-like beta-propeller repeat protein [Blastopirellula retiformator]TWT31537.1 outer membrane biogenesis protein BamB [Blastopirellula retiformator]